MPEARRAVAFGIWDMGSSVGRAAQPRLGVVGLPSGSARNVRVTARGIGVSARPIAGTQRCTGPAATVTERGPCSAAAPLLPYWSDCSSSAGWGVRWCGGDEWGLWTSAGCF